MKNLLTVMMLFFLAGTTFAAETKELDSEDFLDKSRSSLLGYCWIKASGSLNARPQAGKRFSLPIKMSAYLVPNKLNFKTTLAAKDSFHVEHAFTGVKHESKVVEPLKKDNNFTKLGIHPDDLSLSFMYWDFQREYKKESLGLSRHTCRVFLLGNPDKEDEFAKVWLSEKYLGPVKVEWYRGTIKPEGRYQLLSFESFSEKNSVWIPVEIQVENKTGRFQIKFDKTDAQFSKEQPKDLFVH